MKTKLVYNAKDEIDAALTVGFLENHGVEAHTAASKLPTPWLAENASSAMLPRGVYVRERDTEKARAFLKSRGPQKVAKRTERKVAHLFAGLCAAVAVAFMLVVIFR